MVMPLLTKRRLSPFSQWWARLALFLTALYVFLAAIELFGLAMRDLGEAQAKALFSGLDNPFAGLAVGILATVLVQSSSVTTSWIVAMVGAGTLPLPHAVPMVMGANIGTSITNTMVAVGHITRNAPFRRAFAGATVHDMFNLLSVMIFLPIELMTGLLRHGAELLVKPLAGTGGSFESPIKAVVQWFAKLIESCIRDGLHLEGAWLAGVLFVAALAMIIFSLVIITKNMRALMADRIEQWINRVLVRSGLLGLMIGAAITALVQSSSITTSLLIPVFAAGILSLEAGFPIMLGANIGTTVTAMLAATVTGPAGLTIALVHLLFNLAGTAVFFFVKPLRRIPIFLAERLAELTVRNRIWVVAYVFGVFVVAPILGILIWKS